MTSPRGLVRPLCNVAQARYIPSLIAAQVLTWCIAHRDQAGIAKDLIYVMRIVAGLAFFWHIHSVILRSQPLMRVVGFNGTQIRNGTAQRGKKTSCDPPAKQNAEDNIRGPLCPDSIAAYIQAISADALERFFNCVISILAAKSFFPQKIDALLDSSEIQSTQTCEGCGKSAKKRPRSFVIEKAVSVKSWKPSLVLSSGSSGTL